MCNVVGNKIINCKAGLSRFCVALGINVKLHILNKLSCIIDPLVFRPGTSILLYTSHPSPLCLGSPLKQIDADCSKSLEHNNMCNPTLSDPHRWAHELGVVYSSVWPLCYLSGPSQSEVLLCPFSWKSHVTPYTLTLIFTLSPHLRQDARALSELRGFLCGFDVNAHTFVNL